MPGVTTPVGGGLLGSSGSWGGYGGLLQAAIDMYGRKVLSAQNAAPPPHDQQADRAMALMLGLMRPEDQAHIPNPLPMEPYQLQNTAPQGMNPYMQARQEANFQPPVPVTKPRRRA